MSKARIAITMVVTTAFLSGAAGITTAVVAGAATTLYTASAEVNVRSGPSTSTKVLDTLRKGEVVVASGNKSGDWQPVTFNGTTAYVYSAYVKKATPDDTPTTTAAEAKRTTTANVNLRTDATLTSEILKVLKKGTTVDATGRSSGEFTEVKVDGALRWLYSKYLSAGSTPPPPSSVATVVTTSTLALRTSASEASASLGDVKQNTTVGLTGKHSASYTQIVALGKTGWVLTGYLKAAPSGPTVTLPVSVGLRYINASDVNVRKAADVESTKLASLAHATVLQVTGPAKNKYTEIIFNGGLAWVSSEYLSTTKPAPTLGSSSLDKLKATGKAAVLLIRDKFPQIKTIYGWRASSAYSSDHPNGRAIDIMIPSYKSNKALGDKIAQYFITNHKSSKVKYVIWRQRNYTITRGKWVHMADRGGDTANHFDHVHVSFLS